jgi:hypothetical protein
MFDNLRDDATPSFYEEDDSEFIEEDLNASPLRAAPKRKTNAKFLGMTSMQRFIIATMLLIATCTLGSMCLLLTGRIALI